MTPVGCREEAGDADEKEDLELLPAGAVLVSESSLIVLVRWSRKEVEIDDRDLACWGTCSTGVTAVAAVVASLE